ncbi:MAG: DEAD/DEAH box helicase [Planctomycetota bacterium]
MAGDLAPAALPLTSLPGIGPARSAAFARLGVETVRDLLLFAPRRIEASGERRTVAEARAAVGREVAVAGRLAPPSFFRSGRRRSVLRATIADASGGMGALWFNQPWLREVLRAHAAAGEPVELAGRVVATRAGPALATPRIGTRERPLAPPGSLRPLYPLGAGLGQELVRRAVGEAVARHAAALADPLPAEELAAHALLPLAAAVRAVHLPASPADFAAGRRRLALESVLALQAGLSRAGEGGTARAIALAPGRRAALAAALPFRLTAGQERVLGEVFADLARSQPMRRLLHGEVGSGKTLVAAFAAFAVAAAGGQTAILVPTELLAEQHHLELEPLFGRLGVACGLHTAAQPAAARRALLAALADGTMPVVVGTHALLGAGVCLRRLDLAVIDEQQRFGVAQKRALLEKGRDVHVLLLSATPIPRTLALSLYGEIATSLLAELPPGRGEVTTRVVLPGERAAALSFVAERLAAGERAFWICPRIAAADAREEGAAGENGAEGCAAAEAAHARLAAGPLGAFGVGLVHGRIPAVERAARLRAFRAGAARLLVGTSVLEVGIDVPEATVMVVEGPERFGLAQLHQLRGRVGRGPRPACCLLLAARGDAERLSVLAATRDGFAIAEEDLRRRGMGELGGLRQAGPGGEALDPATDIELVLLARRLVLRHPELARSYAPPTATLPALV